MHYKEKKAGPLEFIDVEGDPEAPIFLFFHGFGADAFDLLPFSQMFAHLSPRPRWLFPHGPLKISLGGGYTGKAWFHIDFEKIQQAIQKKEWESVFLTFPQELVQAKALGEKLIAELDIPLSKLFIGGFSQGAVLATDIALSAVDKLAGLIILSGTLVDEKRWMRLASHQAGMHFFQSHGKNDPILPFPYAVKLEHLLTSNGLEGHLHAFEGGHEIPPSTISSLSRFLMHRL